MKPLLFILLILIPTFAFCQQKLIGTFVASNKRSPNFIIFKSDSTFIYPSEYPMFEKTSTGRYRTKEDTIFLTFPSYRVDTVVGYSKGTFIALGIDSTLKSKQDTLILVRDKLYNIRQTTEGGIRKDSFQKVNANIRKDD